MVNSASNDAAPPPTPDVDTCIKSIITLGTNAATLPTAKQTALISSLVGYSVHIAQDQDALAKYMRSGKEFIKDGLPFSNMPAIRELFTNRALFQCLISMLSYNNNTTTWGTASAVQKQHGRKRLPSEDLGHNNNTSRKKPMLSTHPGMGHSRQTSRSNISVGDENLKGRLISMKGLPVYAAIILYSILQHIEHWPVQIMKAFAEDSFGLRNWVDDERCKAFVSNLEMSLKTREQSDEEKSFASLAEEGEAYWESMMKALTPAITNEAIVPSSQTKTLSSKEKRKEMNKSNGEDGSSSSSGEEEVLESESLPTSKNQPSSPDTFPLHSLFHSSSIAKKERVRPRYYMHSLETTHEVISEAFQDRLNSKSKQNYRLLQVLPSFLPIPRVRCLVSRHLERWLQSPALAGLARTLFANAVQEVCYIEPPLPDDIEMIDNILKLNLKANQLPMHIEHITMIAKKLPTQNVAQIIFTHSLQGECSTGSVSNALKPNDDHLRILRSVYSILDGKVAANALACSVSSLTSDTLNQAPTTEDFNSQLHNISCLLCAVVDTLGKLYDGFHFVKAIIKAQSGIPKTLTSVNITARLIFECTLLVTRTVPSLQTGLEAAALQLQRANKKSSFSEMDSVDEVDIASFRKHMLELRKVILRWFVNVLCPVYHNKVIKEEQAKCADTYYERGAVKRGPGALDFLELNHSTETNERPSPFHRMMRLIRCVLFLSDPSGREMATFTASTEEMENNRFQRINFCCQYGIDIDDSMLKTIISSPNITPHTAISVIENLLLRCGSNSTAKVDCAYDTVKEMYKLTEYVPEFRQEANEQDRSKLPRLAVTSLWWRVSSVALVLGGLLPQKVGVTIWQENPTIRALIKMTTSQKYRFPTADCSEEEKHKVRQREEKVKKEEAKYAEILFMPSEAIKKAMPKPQLPSNYRQGLRTSARQRERQGRLLAIEQAREAEALRLENLKIRKVLKILSKNIMTMNPKQDARKPPKGSMDLLVSVNHLFELAEKFRLSISPDFLLQTVGEGRSAIERAYDWLIPIIASHPNIIDRLHPSSSCFLLLRAYGEGEKNRELLELTAPLLSHVSKCLSGELGMQHGVLALELLLQDIATDNADRRSNARKVLQKTIGDSNVMDTSHFHYCNLGQCGWSFQMIHAPNCKELIPLAIQYLSKALAFERGTVLKHYILALYEYNKFIEEHRLDEAFDFDAILCEIVASRPSVCSDTFDRFPDLRALAVAKVHGAFVQALDSSGAAAAAGVTSASSSLLVAITIPKEYGGQQSAKVTHAVVSSNLLHAAIILISNWQHRGEDAQNVDEENAIMQLLRYLVLPYTDKGDSGLSSAWNNHNQKRAVSVEEWVLLAKARAEHVGKHAALSAPSIFLPRLLLCCGLSYTSFCTMLKRLDQMTSAGKTFEDLFTPRAISEWGLLGIGSRRVIKQKLYGRILAYKRIHTAVERDNQELITEESSSFFSWLSSENSSIDITKSQAKIQEQFTSIMSILKSSFKDVNDDSMMQKESVLMQNGASKLVEEQEPMSIDRQVFPPSEDITQEFIKKCLDNDQYDVLEESLDLVAAKGMLNKDTEATVAATTELLSTFSVLLENPSFIRILLKWVPLLTQGHGDDRIWQLIFTKQARGSSHITSLVLECASKWSDHHITACQAWIFQTDWEDASLSLDLALKFLLKSSDQGSIDEDDADGDAIQSYYSYTEKSATSMTKIALLQCASGEKDATFTDGSADEIDASPDCLTLILLLAKSHQALITRLILDKIDDNNKLSPLLLRLYIMYPLEISLSNLKLRNILLQASNDSLPSWLDWQCPLDDQVEEMLFNLTKSPHQRLVQSVTDIAKQHPLIFTRHFKFISQKLLEDGTGRDDDCQSLMKRGRIFGKHPSGDTVAQIGGHMMKVTIVMWGYSFNDPAWTSVLDILLAMPVEVIFSCGAKMGLQDVLEAYLRLFAVQISELHAESNIIHLRDKFIKLLESFKKCKTFEDWVEKDANIRSMLTITSVNI